MAANHYYETLVHTMDNQIVSSYERLFPGWSHRMYTTSSALLDAFTERGISHLFANFGSDHPALIEAIAEARATGRTAPAVITCPNEMVGMSAAHGYWQACGEPQAVLVHVECGTQALAGAVHNAAKGRAPIMIFAGASPFTQNGEMTGSRNEFIQWIQDVHDQRGIVRGYMKYDAELKTGKNVKSMVHRAMQLAVSDPQGPVYLMGAREVMEEPVSPLPDARATWNATAPTALSEQAIEQIGRSLISARRPLVVTSYLGRNTQAVPALVELCNTVGIGVIESVPTWVNYPHDDSLYLGTQWNEVRQNEILAKADVVLVIDSDVPWIPSVSRPCDDAEIFHIDVDPLKEQMPLWHIGATASYRADAETAIGQLIRWLQTAAVSSKAIQDRKAHYSALHRKRVADLAEAEKLPAGAISVPYLVSRLRAHADDNTIFLNETITNYKFVTEHLMPTKPGTMLFSGGGSLGWNGGAAVGVKLARPDATVVAICGDGSYMFSVPSSVHWMARRYETPFLQIVLNNRGWKSPKRAALALHPDGYASRANHVDTSFDPVPDYAGIAAAAGGAWALQVKNADDLDGALIEAYRIVREERRCAVLDVWLDHL